MPSHVSINDDDVYGLGRAENIVALTGGLLDGSEIAAVDFQHGKWTQFYLIEKLKLEDSAIFIENTLVILSSSTKQSML